jgi:tRNA1Val (adenine37-N6)-methyltransferase
MKIGTDGLLLGSWAALEDAESILDIGTGTGLLALMAAQRNPSATIFAVEIDAEAAAQAKENFAASPWQNRLQLLQSSIQQANFTHLFDHLICNPPYFSQGIRSSQKARRTARHTDTLSLRELMMRADQLLSPTGKLSLVIPFDQQKAVLQEAAFFRLFPARMMLVFPKKDVSPKRLLLELGRKRGEWTEAEIIILEKGEYSIAYRELTTGFYLKH